MFSLSVLFTLMLVPAAAMLVGSVVLGMFENKEENFPINLEAHS